MTFVLALYLSKIAVLAFLARITKNKSQLVLYLACSVGFAAFAVASALVVTIGCPVKRDFYWAFAANADACPSQVRNIRSNLNRLRADRFCSQFVGRSLPLLTSSPNSPSSFFPSNSSGPCRCHCKRRPWS